MQWLSLVTIVVMSCMMAEGNYVMVQYDNFELELPAASAPVLVSRNVRSKDPPRLALFVRRPPNTVGVFAYSRVPLHWRHILILGSVSTLSSRRVLIDDVVVFRRVDTVISNSTLLSFHQLRVYLESIVL
jgi:hypothetical protein